MKAAQINKYGGPEVIEMSENASLPRVAPGKVLIKIKAVSLNPFDVTIFSGALAQKMPVEFPFTVGGDFAGVIEEVGSDVTAFKNGDHVFGGAIGLGTGTGACAEFAVTDPAQIAIKPTRASFAQAAGLPSVGLSAWLALVEHAKLAKGQKILIHGGAGGIGSAAIQLAKHLGAYVTATARTENVSYVKGLGADEVIDYKKQLFEKLVREYDAVLDTVGKETYAKSFAVLKKNGIVVSMLEQPSATMMKKFGVRAEVVSTSYTTERLGKVAKLVDEGAISIHIAKSFPLSKTREAFAYLTTGHPQGKVVIEI
jgi:alcohol dehydrogenase